MNINEQEKIINFSYKHDLSCNIENRILNLISEIGILSNMINKKTKYGKEEFIPTPDIDDQIGEAYLVFLELANEAGVNLEDALKRAIERDDIKLSDKERALENNSDK